MADFKSKLDKFLFYFPVQTLANSCCCGFSLKTGVEIISVLSVLAGVFSIPRTLYSEGLFLFMLLNFIVLLCSIIGSIYLFLSTHSNNFEYAFKGYFLFVVAFYLVVTLIVFEVLIISLNQSKVNNLNVLSGFILFLLLLIVSFFALALKLYFLWVIYSYVKLISDGQVNLIENNEEGYQKIQNTHNL